MSITQHSLRDGAQKELYAFLLSGVSKETVSSYIHGIADHAMNVLGNEQMLQMFLGDLSFFSGLNLDATMKTALASWLKEKLEDDLDDYDPEEENEDEEEE